MIKNGFATLFEEFFSQTILIFALMEKYFEAKISILSVHESLIYHSICRQLVLLHSINFIDGHILLAPPLSLLVQSILKTINIANTLHHLLSNFKIGKPNKRKMFHCCYLAV